MPNAVQEPLRMVAGSVPASLSVLCDQADRNPIDVWVFMWGYMCASFVALVTHEEQGKTCTSLCLASSSKKS